MIDTSKAFSGFSVDDVTAAREFYEKTLGMTVTEQHGMLQLTVAGGAQVLVYPKPEPRAGDLHDPELPGAGRRGRRRRAHGPRRLVPAVRGLRPGREGDLPRRRPAHRLVQRPRGQRALGRRRIARPSSC